MFCFLVLEAMDPIRAFMFCCDTERESVMSTAGAPDAKHRTIFSFFFSICTPKNAAVLFIEVHEVHEPRLSLSVWQTTNISSRTYKSWTWSWCSIPVLSTFKLQN